MYDHVSESLDSRGIPANWNQICTAIANVMKTKSGKNMDKDHLVTAVLDRLDKKSRAKSMESIVDAAMAIELTPCRSLEGTETGNSRPYGTVLCLTPMYPFP